MDDKARELIQLWERLDGNRGTTVAHWQDVADHMLPSRNDYFGGKSPGQKRMQKIFDATPIWAVEQLAAGLHGLLTSPSLRWFTMRAEDDRLNENDAVRAWLEDSSERMYAIFNGPRHNFASQSYETYLDLASIGTSVMAVLESQRSGILFSTRHLRECVVQENEEDRIDTLIRCWPYTAKQATEAWGNAAGEKAVKAMADGKPETTFEYLHAVRPRKSRDPQRSDRRHKLFESTYLSKADGTVIDEGGFDEFPYLVPRFSKLTGETYGRGPGMSALPDVKMLNELSKIVWKAAQKSLDPPLQLPDKGFLMAIKTLPGSLNYYRAGTRDRIEPIQSGSKPELGVELITALRQQIIRSFYVEWLMMPSDLTDPASSGKGVTATYVLQQRDEKMRLLSPMVARLQTEFLGPLIDRVFAIMWRRGMFAPAPFQLSGAPLKVEYVSPIAMAQKSSSMESIQRLIQLQAALTQVAPQEPIGINPQAIIQLGGKLLNAPSSAVKTPDQIANENQAKQEAEQAMQSHMALANVASSAKDAAGAVKSAAQADAVASAPASARVAA
jgi:hypothetical protein